MLSPYVDAHVHLRFQYHPKRRQQPVQHQVRKKQTNNPVKIQCM